jgi:hypothetical protein
LINTDLAGGHDPMEILILGPTIIRPIFVSLGKFIGVLYPGRRRNYSCLEIQTDGDIADRHVLLGF